MTDYDRVDYDRVDYDKVTGSYSVFPANAGIQLSSSLFLTPAFLRVCRKSLKWYVFTTANMTQTCDHEAEARSFSDSCLSLH